ncbi:hypothetical protein AB4549_10375 [Vibrio breoganii]|uniref:tetratricopeptide repeat protein n=1 Tax=Vibrio breoganii TaxID=553239 RepID=UPI0003168625|nr:tetratricopeptide repeat protein [Vibrio breoganii]OEF86419.1 hypothetical protein B003_16070 [Vibrio breoganii 1C10]
MNKDNKTITDLVNKDTIKTTNPSVENRVSDFAVKLSEASINNSKSDIKDSKNSKFRFTMAICLVISLSLITYRFYYMTISEQSSLTASKDIFLSVDITPKSAMMEIKNDATMHTTSCGADCQLFMNTGDYTITIYAKDYEPLTKKIKVSEDTELAINMDFEGTPQKTLPIAHTPKDMKAVALFKKSAENGNSNAMYNLGRMYQLGRGIDRDIDLAIQWMRKAAKLGNEKAKDRLQKMNLNWD